MVIIILYLTETRRSGNYASGGVLFVSETNIVEVLFVSDWNFNYHGFTLDVRSINCADRGRYTLAEQLDLNGGYFPCKIPGLIVLDEGTGRLNAIAMKTDSDGNYLNSDHELWYIFTVEGQVNI